MGLSDKYAPLVGDNYSPDKIRVIIPVGGKATRLMPLTYETSKSLPKTAKQAACGVLDSVACKPRHSAETLVFGVKRLH